MRTSSGDLVSGVRGLRGCYLAESVGAPLFLFEEHDMNWLPVKGELFYVRHIGRTVPVHNSEGDVVASVKQQDGSYRTDIFRLEGSDNTMLVAYHAYASHSSYGTEKPVVFRRDEWTISPVGPEVAKALNLKMAVD